VSSAEPSIHDRFDKWLVDGGLYQAFSMDGAETNGLSHRIAVAGIRLDCYCPQCQDDTVFISHPQAKGLTAESLNTGNRETLFRWVEGALPDLAFLCARARGSMHTLRIILRTERLPGDAGFKLMKIGQLPSNLDLLQGDLAKYSKVASPVDLRELNSAAICHAHGFHVAAFVYLRRVFERRLEVAHDAAKEDASWDEGHYGAQRLRMDERMAALTDHLPSFLVKNRKIYNILSKGIHELTEEECQEGYAAVELAIGLILDEEIEQRERSKKLAVAQKSLDKLSERYQKS